MTTSKKILITTGGLLIAILIVGLMLMRDVMENIQTNTLTKIQFVNVPVQSFKQLEISGGWHVTLRQGREYKVEWGSEGDSIVDPTIEFKNGVLYLKSTEDQQYIAKITTPLVTHIKSKGSYKIHMSSFILDTLNVQMEDGGSFIGKENKFIFVRYKTTGDVLLELTDNPME